LAELAMLHNHSQRTN